MLKITDGFYEKPRRVAERIVDSHPLLGIEEGDHETRDADGREKPFLASDFRVGQALPKELTGIAENGGGDIGSA